MLLAAGDRRVAADIAWLMIVQRVGSNTYLAHGLPELEAWGETATALDPTFENVYFIVAAFLTALPDRSSSVDRLLARGEAALPTSSMLPMSRGLISYFGRYDPAAAAAHFEEAVRRGNAPAYLKSFAERLNRLSSSCKSVGSNLASLQNELGGGQSEQGRSVAFECTKRLIERAAAAARLRDEQPTLDQLKAAGELQGMVTFPGECWRLEAGVASLEPCGS